MIRKQMSGIKVGRFAMAAATATSELLGGSCGHLSDAIEGEVREVAKVHAALARQVRLRSRPLNAPIDILSGETTVTMKDRGKAQANPEEPELITANSKPNSEIVTSDTGSQSAGASR